MAGELSLKTPSTGLVTLVPTDTATDKTITLPATTGTMVVQDSSNITSVANLNFTGTGGRITGDFSTATIANRVAFQTSTANSPTVIQAIPSGTSTQSQLEITNNSDPTNSAKAQVLCNVNESRVASAINGSGTYLPMTFYTGGSEAMRITTNRDVGIGSTSPSGRLEVSGSSCIRWQTTDASYINEISTNPAKNAYVGRTYDASSHVWKLSGSNAVTLNSSGNVGIGSVGNTTVRLDVQAATGTYCASFYTNTGAGVTAGLSGYGLAIGGNVSGGSAEVNLVYGSLGGGLAFNRFNGTTISESARLDASGNLFVGTTSTTWTNINGFIFDKVNGEGVVLHNSSEPDGTRYFWFTYNGNQIGSISQAGTTAISFNTTSDYRLKDNIAPMTGALEKVAALKPCTYTWKSTGEAGQGFIAHELQAVVPDCVTGTKDAVDKDGKPQYQGVDTSFLVATLVSAIQELTARLEVLENK